MNRISGSRSNVRCAAGIALVLAATTGPILALAPDTFGLTRGVPTLPDGRLVNRAAQQLHVPPVEVIVANAGPRLPDGRHLNPSLEEVTPSTEPVVAQAAAIPALVPATVPALFPDAAPVAQPELSVPKLFPTAADTPRVERGQSEPSWEPRPAPGVLPMLAAERRLLAAPTPAPVLKPVPPLTPAPPPMPIPAPKLTADPIPTVAPKTAVEQAACKTCGTGSIGPAFDLMTDPNGCYPGRYDDGDDADPSHALGRFLYGIYNCVCVPDPCYEPKWTPLADSAFFTPTARPITQMRFRTKLIRGLATPDRAEYFWARGTGGGRAGDGRRVDRVADDALSMYTEAATGKVGVYSELTYRRVRPDDRPGSSGFGDLVLGTKTLLLDCELLQIAFQFETTVPSANAQKGLGTRHTTLEPSVILGLKLSDSSYFQAQVAEWIPLGGDPDYAGSAIRYNWSYNHVLCRPLKSCPIIGTLEYRGITFQDGAYTDPISGAAVRASGSSYYSFGPGIRQFICDRADLGFACAYGFGSNVAPRQEYRIDLRVRY